MRFRPRGDGRKSEGSGPNVLAMWDEVCPKGGWWVGVQNFGTTFAWQVNFSCCRLKINATEPKINSLVSNIDHC